MPLILTDSNLFDDLRLPVEGEIPGFEEVNGCALRPQRQSLQRPGARPFDLYRRGGGALVGCAS